MDEVAIIPWLAGRQWPSVTHAAAQFVRADAQKTRRLYRRGAFEVLASEPVPGVTNWFMRRVPSSP